MTLESHPTRSSQSTVPRRRAMSEDEPADNSATVKHPSGREPATARGGTKVPDHVLRAISRRHSRRGEGAGTTATAQGTSKAEQYDASLKTWWKEYADRKNDEEEEHVSDSLLYDYTHLPRTSPAPTLTDDRVRRVGGTGQGGGEKAP